MSVVIAWSFAEVELVYNTLSLSLCLYLCEASHHVIRSSDCHEYLNRKNYFHAQKQRQDHVTWEMILNATLRVCIYV